MRKTKPCSKCTADKEIDVDFYVASSDLISVDGRMPICKVCFQDTIDDTDKSSLVNALRSVDRPFIEEYYRSAYDAETNSFSIGNYMRLVSMPLNRAKTYADSEFAPRDMEHFVDDSKMLQDSEVEEENFDMEEFEKRWGAGYEKEDYIFLENEYNKLMDSHEEEIVDSRSAEILIEEALHLRLSIQRKRVRGTGTITGQDVKNVRDLFKAAGISPENQKDNTNEEEESFAKFIEQWENERPIPEPAPEWKDVDNISKFFKVYVLGHLKRMMGIKNDNEEEYWEELDKYTPEILLEEREKDNEN